MIFTGNSTLLSLAKGPGLQPPFLEHESDECRPARQAAKLWPGAQSNEESQRLVVSAREARSSAVVSSIVFLAAVSWALMPSRSTRPLNSQGRAS